ncbi:hypothetical protein C8F04DRAFT_1250200 [Mycena alexandri]|uniref:CxC2-like cysteine cluster KDZ transposase-associated domain-containing protein n=1 Tax=Mycena alexandri TaxID=1745969 RepID=A0AAD6XBX1_9AGAR|nr:hypothetical protein C8F04DRAFT_1250200 [Mycena alexandri]
MPPKRKLTIVDDDDLNDGSDSDHSVEGYAPRSGGHRIHYVPDETISVAKDGRILASFSTVPTPASPSKKTRGLLNPDIVPPEPEPEAPANWQQDFSEFDSEYGPGLQNTGPRALRSSDYPNELWARLDREFFLDELIRHDGRGDYLYQDVCANPHCDAVDPGLCCTDCLYPCLYCTECLVRDHYSTPLHHIEIWNGQCFERRSLKSLGLRIQLGHPWGQVCPNPSRAPGDDFVVVNTHTIDEVGLDFCGCGTAQPHRIQLLRMGLYPATGSYPRSAATFAALRRFDFLSLESKCSAYEFYNSLARETDNTGIGPERERYEEFLRMTRQWQNLHLLKRAGRGHDPAPNRIEATKPGECALLCPTCPQPQKNLPRDWEKVPFEKAFLYALFLAIDANFRLKRKDVSSEENDPGLGDGWSFFVPVKPYMKHLDAHWDQKQERSTCVAHDAVDKPDRESLGTVSSGIGTVDCARHNMKRPNAVGDLQKGERYLNMDYLFFISLAGSPLARLYVSYDIACQWHKNIWERMRIFDFEGVQFKEGEKYVVFLVPKFHLPAHIEECNISFSFNLTPFVGRTDGEAPERGWADANRLANSTSVSGPGARRDTLNIHFQWWNWKKIVALGGELLKRMQKYVPLMLEARAAWIDMEDSFPVSVIETWTAMAVAWETDSRKPNPFKTTVRHENLREVRRKLAVIASEDVEHLHVRGDMHETEMLSMGLQLEEQQRGLATHVKHVGAHETVDQGRRHIERETKLRRKVNAWMAVQQLFIPEVTVLRDREDTARNRTAATQPMPGIRAQDMRLWLPSAIGTRVECDAALQEYEYDLRQGQAFESLDEIRNQLIVRTHQYNYQDAAVHGVKGKTRSATKIQGIDARIHRAEEEYRAAYAALLSLGRLLNRAEWQLHLKVLRAEDVRPRPQQLFGDEERQRGGNRRKKARLDSEAVARRKEQDGPMAWIWISQAGAAEEVDVVENEPLRIEWAKTRAKAMRYAEEVDLLEEEMRRVTQFMEWRAEQWRALVGVRDVGTDEALQEGHAAYAHKQAGYMSAISGRFQALWKDVPEFLRSARATYASMEVDDDDTEEEESAEGPEPHGAAWLSD